MYHGKGRLEVGIDYSKGDPVHIHTEEGFDRQGWMNGKRKLAAELVPSWTEAVKAKYGGLATYGTEDRHLTVEL